MQYPWQHIWEINVALYRDFNDDIAAITDALVAAYPDTKVTVRQRDDDGEDDITIISNFVVGDDLDARITRIITECRLQYVDTSTLWFAMERRSALLAAVQDLDTALADLRNAIGKAVNAEAILDRIDTAARSARRWWTKKGSE